MSYSDLLLNVVNLVIVKQEEKTPIEDFSIKYNLNKVFNTIIDKAGDIEVETEELKVFCDEAANLLKQFVKHIEKVEKEEIKNAAKNKFNELVKKGASYDD